MVDYILAAAARTQAAAMIAHLETLRPGAAQALARDALAELQAWEGMQVRQVPENQTGARCSVAGAYDPGPPPRISVADSTSTSRQGFTALHELGHHLQQNDLDLMEVFEDLADAGRLLEDAACDAFAAEILLPTPLADRHMPPFGPTADNVVALWQNAAASRMAVCVRAAQHLPAPGHVLLLQADGHLAFGASHGLPPPRRGSYQGDIPVLDRALAAAGGRVQGQARLRYRDGITGQELYVQTAPMGGYLLAVAVTDLAPWRAFAPGTREPGLQASEYVCEQCGHEYRSFDKSCSSCGIPACPECAGCGCAQRVAQRLCPGCFTVHPPAMFADGAQRCLDCS